MCFFLQIKAEPIHATQVVKTVRQLRSELVKVAEDVATLQQQQEQVAMMLYLPKYNILHSK